MNSGSCSQISSSCNCPITWKGSSTAVVDPGEGRGGAEKIGGWLPPPPPVPLIFNGRDDWASPLSQGLDLALHCVSNIF